MVEDQALERVRQHVQEKAGQRLAGERELAAQFGLSRPSLRAILDILEREGLLQRRQGSGTYALSRDAGKLRRALILIDSSFKLGDDPFVSRLVECLQKELQEIGAQCSMQRMVEEEAPLRNYDGVIALGLDSVRAAATAANDALPAVGLFTGAETCSSRYFSLLELADLEAGRQAARRLVEAGVDQIFFCGRHNLSAVQQRLSGVEMEMRGSDIPLQIFECGLNYAAGFQLGLQFSGSNLGVIAANDWLALGIHTGLQSARPSLREKVRLVSLDGLPLTAQTELGIASLAVPLESMAADAITELLRLRRGKAAGRSIRYSLEWR